MSRWSPRIRLLVVLLAGLLVASQSVAVSSTTADRRVSVSVADDEDALLGVQLNENVVLENTTGERVRLLTLTNRFPAALTSVTVTLAEGNATALPRLRMPHSSSDLDAGASGDVTAYVECSTATGTETVHVDVTATGDGVSVVLTRDVTVACVE